MSQIGIVGIGTIGSLFLDRLLDAGYDVAVYDVDDDRIAAATDAGATATEGVAALARWSDVVVLAVPGTPEVEATMEGSDGEDGLVDALDTGDLVIDASTTRPATSVVCEEWCESAGIEFLETPITGGAPREGYHVMVGGREDNYERANGVLDAISDDHARVGTVPDATVLKLGLQLRYAGRSAVDAEVVEFVRDNGVDPAILTDFFAFDVSERLLSGDFGYDGLGLGALDIWHKDVGYARAFARENGTALPIGGVLDDAYKASTRRAGADERDASAIVNYWLALNDGSDRYA